MKYALPHFDRIFGAGGYFDHQPAAADELESSNISEIGFLGEIFPSSAYKRVPHNIQSEDEAFLNLTTSFFDHIETQFDVCAPSVALELKGCLISDSVIYVPATTDYQPLYHSYRPNDRPYVRALDNLTSPKPSRTFRAKKRRLFYLGSAGSSNFGHWLIDDLPRLKYLFDNPQPTTIIIQTYGGMDRVRLETLKVLTRGLDVDIKIIKGYDIVNCDVLTYVTPVSYHPVIKNVDAMQYLREKTTQAVGSKGRGPDKLFVQRGNKRLRQIDNLTEIEILMKSRGFKLVDPEYLSFKEQVALFSHASLIVGTMCAAMCNTAFTPTGAKLVYLSPNEWVEPFYWDMASTLGHEYYALHGTRKRNNPEPHLDDFLVDAQALSALLDTLVP